MNTHIFAMQIVINPSSKNAKKTQSQLLTFQISVVSILSQLILSWWNFHSFKRPNSSLLLLLVFVFALHFPATNFQLRKYLKNSITCWMAIKIQISHFIISIVFGFFYCGVFFLFLSLSVHRFRWYFPQKHFEFVEVHITVVVVLWQ